MAEVRDPENTLILETTKGKIVIELFADLAPCHVMRIKELADEGAYDNVVFHRVIDGFMAQTGDVQFGKKDSEKFNSSRVGMGGSDKPDLKAEFSNFSHKRGIVSMARSQNPNSANSQFFICLADAPWLDRQYSVWGQVIEGMENVDKIKRGEPVVNPDVIIKATIAANIE
ncbi:peptidyl-prolyl cis-trans isomerase B, cyclophilin type [Bartonella australis AUST/NH1]|uniref:Peptidyl-prolyl cis-trans isomerase n=1 Tax=Bartonella australis (strain Aust/NH1) TaxID=1094489 RepID=M1NTI5_BARAA|nr:peptidylprolyl isomerase [Bartonella australis]AGF74623.1 peptidyl-prolyl cis-trans isomerase B, cyclophilin type [Bartonella australis AUST/NH1]